MTIEEELEEFRHWLTHKERPVRESTVEAYTERLQHLVDYCRDRGIDSFKPGELGVEALEGFRDAMIDREKAGYKNVEGLLMAAKVLVKWSEDPSKANRLTWRPERWSALSYHGPTRQRRRKRVQELPMLMPSDVLELMSIAAECSRKTSSTRNAALIAVMYSSGARLSEAVSMRVKDVYREGKTWRVRFPDSKHPAGTRTGYLTQFAGDKTILRWVHARRQTARDMDEPLFLTSGNRAMTSEGFQSYWRRVTEKAIQRGGELAEKMQRARDLAVAAHLLRHSRGKWLGQMKNWQYAPLKAWLGDETDQMVGHYVQAGGVEAQLARERGEAPEEAYEEPESRCTICGVYVLPGDNYCPACGAPLSDEAKAHEVGMGRQFQTLVEQVEELRELAGLSSPDEPDASRGVKGVKAAKKEIREGVAG
jgi:site-specific recombinase XerC